MRGTDAIKGKHLYLDCYSGIAGDMFLGAMLDLGVPEAVIRNGLDALPLDGYVLQVGRARRMNIEGCDVKVHISSTVAQESHHSHRSYRNIRTLIESAPLGEGVKRRALDIFGRIARAEARLHGSTLDEVTFHEVGAIDSIVDIVGAALALDYLAPARVTSRPIPLGHGTIRCAHGVFPVPSPAALEILTDLPVEDGGVASELCTPTGAAIVASCAEGFGPIPAAAVIAAGYGAGDTDLSDRPNHLRVILFELSALDPAETEAVVIEANVDDMPPEWCGHLMEQLFAAGARDVWYTPIVMKKGRPALTVGAMCSAVDLQAVGAALLRESTTIGLRYHAVGRRTLSRRVVEVQTPYGPQSIKLAMEGERIVNASPEFERCKEAAERSRVPLKEVYAATLTAWRTLAGPKGS